MHRLPSSALDFPAAERGKPGHAGRHRAAAWSQHGAGHGTGGGDGGMPNRRETGVRRAGRRAHGTEGPQWWPVTRTSGFGAGASAVAVVSSRGKNDSTVSSAMVTSNGVPMVRTVLRNAS